MLWITWYNAVVELRGACSRYRTFVWMVIALVGFSIRSDMFGVTSFIRSGFVQPAKYHTFLHFFNSDGLKLKQLTALWVRLAVKRFAAEQVDGYTVFIADGQKIPKEGKKMPGVKLLHQESDSNTKPAYIMGHSFQVISLLVKGMGTMFFAVPLMSRICEGIVLSNRDKKTQLDKLMLLFQEIITALGGIPSLLIADSYYASQKIIHPLLSKGNHLITRAAINAVAYEPAPVVTEKKRGRPPKYGPKIKLSELFLKPELFTEVPSPLAGDHSVKIRFLTRNLLWRHANVAVRFVLVIHPSRGKIILLSTHLSLDPLEIIRLYSLRFKIEVSFKQAVHTIGIYTYRFWMKSMTPLKKRNGTQYLHKKSTEYRRKALLKIEAYHRYVQIGCIAQGLLMLLSVNHHTLVWNSFRSWLRTMKPNLNPSEMVVSMALRNSFPDFLLNEPDSTTLKKIIMDNSDPVSWSIYARAS